MSQEGRKDEHNFCFHDFNIRLAWFEYIQKNDIWEMQLRKLLSENNVTKCIKIKFKNQEKAQLQKISPINSVTLTS